MGIQVADDDDTTSLVDSAWEDPSTLPAPVVTSDVSEVPVVAAEEEEEAMRGERDVGRGATHNSTSFGGFWDLNAG